MNVNVSSSGQGTKTVILQIPKVRLQNQTFELVSNIFFFRTSNKLELQRKVVEEIRFVDGGKLWIVWVWDYYITSLLVLYIRTFHSPSLNIYWYQQRGKNDIACSICLSNVAIFAPPDDLITMLLTFEQSLLKTFLYIWML